MVGRAKVTFLSGDAKANVVGAVASLLLIVNEAQDVEPAVYDRNFAPMAASTNATRLFMGTAWTSHTLLARELRAARQAEQVDGSPPRLHIRCGRCAPVAAGIRRLRGRRDRPAGPRASADQDPVL